ncbi:MAG: helix-turn-helix transcriptional regulator [Leptolyngbya sp. SIOISBB]|nr:helix-turn-helix transcriptional regulator [Leptolyngbya sp. SIOISBB]
MTTLNITLSADTIPTMMRASQQQTGGRWRVDTDELSWDLDESFGIWESRCIQVREGLDMVLNRAELRQEVTFIENIEQLSNWAVRFCLSGRAVQCLPGHNAEIALRPGINLIGFMAGRIEAKTCYAANQTVEVLTLGIQSEQFADLLSPDHEGLNFGQTLAHQTAESTVLVTMNQTTPAMLSVLHKIMNCPYQGTLKRLYLESKALELIVMKLAQVQQSALVPRPQFPLKGEDIERLYRARDILVGNLTHPPSLKALAHQTEMNDFKLKRGFREVFGTTVFGYLHQCRMEKAQWLLEQGTHSVAHVAHAIGYASPSQFSAAFKRQFGVTPKSYKAL